MPMPTLAARLLSLSLGALLLPGFSQAAVDSELPKVSVSGFGTAGMVYSSTREADFIRDLSQPSGAGRSGRIDFGVDSRLGLQLNLRASDTVEGAFQVVSRRRYDGSFMPEVHWAYVKFSPSETAQLRLGRLAPDLYMLADSRHIGYSYFQVRPPVEYFGTLPISYLDGADFVLKHPVGAGIMRAKLYAGIAREKMRSDGGRDYDLAGTPAGGGFIEYQEQEWTFRVGYSRIHLERELPGVQPLLDALRSPMLSVFGPTPAQFADDAMLSGKRVRFYSAGAAYDSGPIQAQLVMSHLVSDSLSYQSSDSGYLTLAYRHKEWVPYISYSAVRSKDTRRDTGLPRGLSPGLDALIAGARRLETENGAKQHTVSLGVRYDFMRNADLKVQLDRVHCTVPFYWREVQPGWNGRATVLSVTLDFVF